MSSVSRPCPHCGAQMSANAKFCRTCGKPVAAEPVSAPPVIPAVERKCPACGATLSQTAKFCAACGKPITEVSTTQRPLQPRTLPSQQAPAPVAPVRPSAAPVQPKPAAPRPRARSGCACPAVIGFLLLLCVCLPIGVLVARRLLPSYSDNLTLGPMQQLASTTTGPNGGTIRVQAPGSAVNGLTIQVPSGAYAQSVPFTISTRSIEKQKFGNLFQPASPLIRIENNHVFAKEPLQVEIPIQIAANEFAMAFAYDERTGKLEGIPLVSLTRDKLTILTAHFSDIVVSKVDQARLDKTIVDSGFRPGVDDWQFTNEGSIIAQEGHCAGQSFSAMWYYYERRLGAGDPPLYGRFDNNRYGLKTPGLWADDSWSYRFVSTVHDAMAWDSWSRDFQIFVGKQDDRLPWYATAFAMALTGEPQYILIFSQADDRHAIIAYKMDQNRIYVADPNYPGKSDRAIRYENGKFLPYSSGPNAKQIRTAGFTDYTKFTYIAKWSFIDWKSVGKLYQQMLDGKVGQGRFPAYTIKIATEYDPIKKEPIWTAFPQVVELDDNKIDPKFAGKLRFLYDSKDTSAVSIYQLTDLLDTYDNLTDGWVLLQPGVNHVGFYTQVKAPDNNYYYNDFYRVKVLYGIPDLTGTWQGTLAVEDTTNASEFVTTILREVITQMILTMGLTQDEQEARKTAAASVKPAPPQRYENSITMVLEPVGKPPSKQYKVRAYALENGVRKEYTGDAVYDQGAIQLKIRPDDGTTFDFKGDIAAKNQQMSGTFSVTLWGGLSNAMSGSWQLEKK